MVKHVHLTLDDEDFEKLRDKKDELGLTWEGFVLKLYESTKVPPMTEDEAEKIRMKLRELREASHEE